MGHRAIILVMVQRSGAKIFSPADQIDPEWGQTLRKVLALGVEVMVFEVELSVTAAVLGRPIAVKL
jgi:sugar fermentation stimulation protein A